MVDLKGKDPDDAFSSVPYEKGFVFLYHLENLIGKAKFDGFITHYFSTFACKSLDSFEFKDCLLSFFPDLNVDWDAWFYKPGYPPRPNYDTSLADFVYTLADRWQSPERFEPTYDDVRDLTANQIVVFLERVEAFEPSIGPDKSRLMDQVYRLSGRQNVEITARYFRVALRARDMEAKGPAARLLGEVGRMKFVRPLFKALNEVDRDLALQTFEKNEDFYHPICRQMVRQDLYGAK